MAGMSVHHDDQPHDLATDLRLAIGRLARRLRLDSATGLTPSQLSALAGIDAMGTARLVDLAAGEGVSAPTMTKIVASLARDRLVERGDDPVDRRCVQLRLTTKGRSTLRHIRSERTAVLARLLADLTPAEVAALRTATPLLTRLAEGGR